MRAFQHPSRRVARPNITAQGESPLEIPPKRANLQIQEMAGNQFTSGDDPRLIPPGWDYNPATWSQRIPIVVLALAGAGISIYLAIYQYDMLDRVWEPFFGESKEPDKNSSEYILSSELSFPLERLHPALAISDAALGAAAYLVDAITGVIGGRGRWRKMPWVVVMFAFFVGPLGLTSVFLTVAQPVLYGQWCTLCLGSAAISLLMIGPAMDEALASCQFLRRVYDTPGVSLWKAFWGRHSCNSFPH